MYVFYKICLQITMYILDPIFIAHCFEKNCECPPPREVALLYSCVH